jgi:hypothetical protein
LGRPVVPVVKNVVARVFSSKSGYSARGIEFARSSSYVPESSRLVAGFSPFSSNKI